MQGRRDFTFYRTDQPPTLNFLFLFDFVTFDHDHSLCKLYLLGRCNIMHEAMINKMNGKPLVSEHLRPHFLMVTIGRRLFVLTSNYIGPNLLTKGQKETVGFLVSSLSIFCWLELVKPLGDWT
jgi:hypothetical protein